ncbi:hypothetical protein [Streptomyces fulvoviolaceus]|uniref:hypothetical protein n=1 Tax=Streptomyces fulvoviolaceus TaxID=285535 RepID=UPI0021C0FB06|nr:hypothetical protein [Streptomyces fulvoviolaceus]MCT9081706.1 hypothetical protein [Streptomyces fulvoviolaceus]
MLAASLCIVLGLAVLVSGGWVALDIRSAAAAIERWQERNHELRMTTVGDFTPSQKWITATGFRVVAGGVCLVGLILILMGLVNL